MKIFLNYRPGITDPPLARRIVDCLLASGAVAEVVTTAVADPKPSDAEIARTVTSCDAFVAVIGPGWADVGTASGRLINDPADPIRIEIVAALNRIMPLVPVLMDGASLPEPYDIDRALQGLTLRDAIVVESADLERGCARLMDILAPGASSPPAEPARGARNERSGAAKAKPPPPRPKPAPPPTETQPQAAPRPGRGRSSALLWGFSILIVVGLVSGGVFVISTMMHLVNQVFNLLGILPKWL